MEKKETSEVTQLIELSDASFETRVLRQAEQSVVFFWAPWSKDCEAQRKHLESVTAEHPPRFQVAQINVEKSPMLSLQYDIVTLPTLLLIHQGKVLDALHGYTARHQVATLFEKARAIPSPLISSAEE